VALKILPAAAGSSFAERFNREARALARLSHPNIVAVHEFGQVNGQPFFIMEYVDGASLRQLEQTGRLSPREALQIIPQLCDALQYAHDQGVVHRDIKPENVLVDRKGRVKIADFGLAKILGYETQNFRLTGEGQIMGTPHYMAPEQVEHPLQVDHRADIYSLGVVLYEMLTGELPLGKFPLPSHKVQLDVRLDEVVLHALEKEPERRYQQASQVKTAVEGIASTPTPPPLVTSNVADATRNVTSGEAELERREAREASAGQVTAHAGQRPPPQPVARAWGSQGAQAWRLIGALVVLLVIGICAGAVFWGIRGIRAARAQAQAMEAKQRAEAEKDRARARIAKTLGDSYEPGSVLQFRWVAEDGATTPADELPDPADPAGRPKLRVLPEVVLNDTDIASATGITTTNGTREITVLLTLGGTKKLTALTARNIGRRLAIVHNGQVLSAPIIRSTISGFRMVITGKMEVAEMQRLVAALNKDGPDAEEPSPRK
jgi:type II secretory pathway pseudopilin PulG